jgi:hypothetical protein
MLDAVLWRKRHVISKYILATHNTPIAKALGIDRHTATKYATSHVD